MKRRLNSLIPRELGLVAAVLSVPLLLAAAPKLCVTDPPTPESYTWDFKRETLNLLDETADRAYQIQDHAANLQAFTRSLSHPSWQTHAAELTQVREQVNAVGEDLCRMHIIRHVTDPWQQATVDRITPRVVALGNQTEAAIAHLDENRNWVTHPDYRANVSAIYEDAMSLREAAKSGFESTDGRLSSQEESVQLAANFCGF